VNGLSTPGTSGLKLTRWLTVFGARTPNHRLERAVVGGWLYAASALRYCALASRGTRWRAAAQPHR
jgi:hypothetical protein